MSSEVELSGLTRIRDAAAAYAKRAAAAGRKKVDLRAGRYLGMSGSKHVYEFESTETVGMWTDVPCRVRTASGVVDGELSSVGEGSARLTTVSRLPDGSLSCSVSCDDSHYPALLAERVRRVTEASSDDNKVLGLYALECLNRKAPTTAHVAYVEPVFKDENPRQRSTVEGLLRQSKRLLVVVADASAVNANGWLVAAARESVGAHAILTLGLPRFDESLMTVEDLLNDRAEPSRQQLDRAYEDAAVTRKTIREVERALTLFAELRDGERRTAELDRTIRSTESKRGDFRRELAKANRFLEETSKAYEDAKAAGRLSRIFRPIDLEVLKKKLHGCDAFRSNVKKQLDAVEKSLGDRQFELAETRARSAHLQDILSQVDEKELVEMHSAFSKKMDVLDREISELSRQVSGMENDLIHSCRVLVTTGSLLVESGTMSGQFDAVYIDSAAHLPEALVFYLASLGRESVILSQTKSEAVEKQAVRMRA